MKLATKGANRECTETHSLSVRVTLAHTGSGHPLSGTTHPLARWHLAARRIALSRISRAHAQQAAPAPGGSFHATTGSAHHCHHHHHRYPVRSD